MRTAPAVHLSLEADTPWRVGLCLLGAAAAAAPVMGLALCFEAPPAWALGAAAAAALPAGAWSWRHPRSPATALAWDGAQWWLQTSGPAHAGRVQLMIDLGPWVLLRFQPAAPGGGRAHWLALSQACHRVHWHALRCALHAQVAMKGAAADAPRQG